MAAGDLLHNLGLLSIIRGDEGFVHLRVKGLSKLEDNLHVKLLAASLTLSVYGALCVEACIIFNQLSGLHILPLEA